MKTFPHRVNDFLFAIVSVGAHPTSCPTGTVVMRGHAVEPLCYKPEGSGFESL
jgi:hypothetical protein